MIKLICVSFSHVHMSGHSKTVFSSFRVSPDNQLLAFIGKDGFIPLVSNKVSY